MNAYFKRPLLYDALIILVLILICELICYKWWCLEINRDTLRALLNELVSSSVSVGGFIIASLTIIVSMKDSVKKPVEESKNGLELMMNGRYYPKLVNVFKVGSWIFIFTFLGFSVLEVVDKAMSDKTALYLIIVGLGFTVLALIRCLLMLQMVIKLQIKAHE